MATSSHDEELLLAFVLLESDSRVDAPEAERGPELEKVLLLAGLEDQADRSLAPQILDDLLRLVGMTNVVRELLEILLEPLVFLLIVRQRLQALLLRPLVLIDLALPRLPDALVLEGAHNLALKSVLLVAGPHQLGSAEVSVVAGRAPAPLRVEAPVSVERILLEVLLLQDLSSEAVVALRRQLAVLPVRLSQLLAFLVELSRGFPASVEAVSPLLSLQIGGAISLDSISEFKQLVRQLHRLLPHVGGLVQVLAVEPRPVGGHH